MDSLRNIMNGVNADNSVKPLSPKWTYTVTQENPGLPTDCYFRPTPVPTFLFKRASLRPNFSHRRKPWSYG